jgi:type IV pilus assembly protein PilC
MPQFLYQARDVHGAMVSGVIAAADLSEAGHTLRGEGKFIVKLAEGDEAELQARSLTLEERYRRIRRDDVIHFTHQMSVMIETGVTLGEALESVAGQAGNEHLRAVLQDVSDAVQSGQSFSRALARHPRVFPALMVSMVTASETSGTMGTMLQRVSGYLTKERNTLRSVRGAMTYPIVMTVVALAVTVFLLIFVLPRFGRIYADRGALLPGPTRVMLGASELITTYWYVWIPSIGALIGGLIYVCCQPWGRRGMDWLKLHTPILGPMFERLYLTRACRTMGTMISAGVPMLDMVAIVKDVTKNSYYEELWDAVDGQLRQGCQLSSALFASPLIPNPVSRMVHSGEKAGRLGPVMDKIAEFAEHDFDESVKRVTEFIEPAMVTLMGLLIGFVAISLLLPIFSVGRVMAG